MNETKPFFIIKKYRSILRATLIIEAVNFFVSLTDSIIAGNAVGAEAFAAIGLLAPFLSIATFFASIVNTGTVLNFSYQVGKFNKRRANEFFSQGVFTALLSGALYAVALLIFGNLIISCLSPTEEIKRYLNEYYYIILLSFFIQPLSFLMDYIVIADGGEKISVVANVTQIFGNILLSLLFVELWGLKGIAVATVLSKVLFVLIVSLHFFSKKNTLKLVRHRKWADCFSIYRNGIVNASTYGFEAVATFSINLFALTVFDDNTLVILVVIERFLGLMTLFIGLSMACQPIIGTLRGENNTKAQHILMRTVLHDMITASLFITAMTLIGAPLMVTLFGINEGEVHSQAVSALRIVSCTLVLQAILVLFYIYFMVIEKRLLAFSICLIKNFLSPVVVTVVLALVLGSHIGIWVGLAVAPIIANAVSAVIVYLKYGKMQFPFLIPESSPDQQIYIFDFTIDADNASKMAQAADGILRRHSMPSKACTFAGLITEETLMLIMDRNKASKKAIKAECTVITQSDGVSLILRDSGEIFDITDTDSDVDSFRQYIVSNLMVSHEVKLYMTTTGYNRNEFFFSSER